MDCRDDLSKFFDRLNLLDSFLYEQVIFIRFCLESKEFVRLKRRERTNGRRTLKE